MDKHTPGPWNVETWEYPDRTIGRKTDLVIASPIIRIAILDHLDRGWKWGPVDFAILYEEAEANARLLAAAPELLDAVEDAHRELSAQAEYFGNHLDPENELFRVLRKLEAVAAKARGAGPC